MNVGPQAIGCETCESMGWDDGSWNKWTPSATDPAPTSRTYHVCHQCLLSPREYWKDFFLLCQKSKLGTVHLPQSEQPTASELEESCVASDQQSEDTSVVEQYQRFEDLFEHSPLDHDQIRLLSLLPSRDDLLCTIEKIDLNSAAAQYEALSYCWGSDEQPKHTIWINGHPFVVLSNLYAALTQLRKPTSTRKLWIDAICINQVGDEGKAEKNTQIPLMSKIYHQAASIIAWLGAAEYDSNKTLDIIVQQNVDAMQNREFATDFGRLLKRPWFRRTWIVQEFALGKTLPRIMCGSRIVPYGKFMATHWILPMLVDRFPDMTVVQLQKIVHSDGNVVSSQTFKQRSSMVWESYNEAEKTLANLTNAHRAILDDEGRLRPKGLYKILPLMKNFDATDFRDKIYGTFGIVSVSVHQSLQVDYQKSVAEVYRDAMTYMLREEKDEPRVVDLYLDYPLSLSLELSTPGLPSWVPDFSQNCSFLRVHEDIIWYWLYHQNSTLNGHTPLIRKQHGRHTVTIDKIDRHLLFVDDTRLSVRGFLIDEVDAFVESRFFAFNGGQNMRDYSERQMKSSSEASQKEGRQIKSLLDVYDKYMDETIPEITFQADDFSLVFASTLGQRYRIDNLYNINEICRKKFAATGRSLDSESWLTFIWRDLLEGYSTLDNVSEEEFNNQFYDLVQSEKAVSSKTWLRNAVWGEPRTVKGIPQLNIPLRELFQPPRTFFTTKTSGFYGISPPGVQKGDKLAFLFPQAYMAFILRPSGENFQMVGPCIVPPRLRDSALENLYSPTYKGDEFVLI